MPDLSDLGASDDGGPEIALPPGQVYDWYRDARAAHDAGDPATAVSLLQWAVAAEPQARSVREALARALFDDHRFVDSAASFASITEEDPADHYAQFGYGLASFRSGDLDNALGHLAIAVALRPDVAHYEKALRAARAARVRQAGPPASEGEDT